MKPQTKSTRTSRARSLCCLVFAFAPALGLSGCLHRAQTDLYIEHMAREKRSLEDLVFEFDAEYRAMENELEDMRRANAALESRLRDAERVRQETRPDSRSLIPDAPARTEPPPLRIAPKEKPSELEVPEVIIPKKPPVVVPEPLPPQSDSPAEAILPSSPTSAKQPLRSSAPAGLPSDVSDASLEQRRIAAPVLGTVQLASATNVPTAPSPSTKSPPTDTLVRQIEFHPNLCRGQNLDGKPGDDGLYLVLVPRNVSQEFVPTSGRLTVVLEESLPDSEPSRIGRFEFTAEELSELLEPIGSGQGFHLKLAWQDQVPEGSAIDAYVRFTDQNGTTMVNHKQLHLRRSGPGQATWTPR